MKNPTIATVMNIIPGLGYLYIGGKKRIFGVALITAGIAAIISAFDPLLSEYMNSAFRIWDYISLVSLITVTGGFMYDGYVSANEHNQKLKKR